MRRGRRRGTLGLAQSSRDPEHPHGMAGQRQVGKEAGGAGKGQTMAANATFGSQRATDCKVNTGVEGGVGSLLSSPTGHLLLSCCQTVLAKPRSAEGLCVFPSSCVSLEVPYKGSWVSSSHSTSGQNPKAEKMLNGSHGESNSYQLHCFK